jgi:hypothetical protein
MGYASTDLGHHLRFLLDHWAGGCLSRRGNLAEKEIIRVYLLPAMPFANRVLKFAPMVQGRGAYNLWWMISEGSLR